MDDVSKNLRDLECELAWITEILDRRFKLYFGQASADGEGGELGALRPPSHARSTSHFARFLREHRFSFGERLALAVVLVTHLRPRLFDVFFTKNATFDRRFTEFGGARTGADDEFVPTGETLAFILGGADLRARVKVQAMLDADHVFARLDILRAVPQQFDQPLLKAPLRLSPELLSLFTSGRQSRPQFGADFPAQRIETALRWEDLVLHASTLKQLGEIKAWMKYGDTLMKDWGMAARLRPGHRSLFYGPPGTGKSTTAALIGKETGCDVYRVDLSLVVSKYIGETEKNLARVFDRAEHHRWVLFFDEADALFGKRSQIKDAHDRYANQEISFLLQRIESFDGVVILATNLRDNLDEAFTRRFESVIYFPVPRPAERLRLWQQGFSPKARLEATNLEEIAQKHELTGGSIMNVIRHVSLAALAEGGRAICQADVVQGIQHELAKEARP